MNTCVLWNLFYLEKNTTILCSFCFTIAFVFCLPVPWCSLMFACSCLLIYIDFLWFTLISTDLNLLTLIHTDLHWFPLIYTDLHGFTLIYINLYLFTLTYIDLHCSISRSRPGNNPHELLLWPTAANHAPTWRLRGVHAPSLGPPALRSSTGRPQRPARVWRPLWSSAEPAAHGLPDASTCRYCTLGSDKSVHLVKTNLYTWLRQICTLG